MTTDQTYEFVEQVRLLIENMHDSEEDLSKENEKEPGQLTDEGDIVFTFNTTDGEQHSQHNLDSQLFQQIMKSEGYQLLDVYNSHAIYLCKNNEMKRKINTHMTRTNAYVLIEELGETNPTCVQQHLDEIVKQVNKLLNGLVQSHGINVSQFRQMCTERSEVRMDYLFFLPDVRQKSVPFQPIMVCSLGPTVGIARFISRLLQPIYDQAALSTTFFKETDAVHAIDMYTNQGFLLPTTLFATLHINDLCTIVSHEEMIQALQRFLNDYYKPDQYSHGISTDTIVKLIQMVLQNQMFVFEKKVYRQIKGGATESPLTILSMNIYLFYWQEDLVKILINKNEIFGRCFDQVFLTWNGSKNELRSLLHGIINKNKQSPTLYITTSIGKKINYIDARICHIKGRLQTKINHDTDTEPRVLPFVSGHPRHMYSTLIRASLIRAVLCCSNILDFNNERRDIEETFYTNGYARDSIQDHVKQFFREFHALKLISNAANQSKYKMLRHRVYTYDQQQMDMKIRQRKDEQDKQLWYITSTFKGETLIEYQEKFINIWNEFFETQSRNIGFEIISQPKYPSNTK